VLPIIYSMAGITVVARGGGATWATNGGPPGERLSVVTALTLTPNSQGQ
jgi:hypothetical protein